MSTVILRSFRNAERVDEFVLPILEASSKGLIVFSILLWVWYLMIYLN